MWTTRKLAESILRSPETIAAGVMGPFRVGYSVRIIAYELVDLPTQLWIKSLLIRFERMYAGLNTRSFPPAGGDSPPLDLPVEETPPPSFRRGDKSHIPFLLESLLS